LEERDLLRLGTFLATQINHAREQEIRRTANEHYSRFVHSLPTAGANSFMNPPQFADNVREAVRKGPPFQDIGQALALDKLAEVCAREGVC
jgi:hypothetical protein